MPELQLTLFQFVQQYAETHQGGALQQALADPSTRFLIEQACTERAGKSLVSRDPTNLSEFARYVMHTVIKYEGGNTSTEQSRERVKAYKAFLLTKLRSDDGLMRDGVHFILRPGGSLVTGKGVELTSVGKDVALSQGVQGWEAFSVAYTTLTEQTMRPVFNELCTRYIAYREEWAEKRNSNTEAFRSLKEAVVEAEGADHTDPAAQRAAQAKMMRHDKTLYKSFIPDGDTTRGGMTGQLVRAKGLAAADAPISDWKTAMKKAVANHTVSSQLSRLGQARQELMRAEVEDMHEDYPQMDLATIAERVSGRAKRQKRNFSTDSTGKNLLPPDVQRRKNFNHAAHVPPPAALLALTNNGGA